VRFFFVFFGTCWRELFPPIPNTAPAFFGLQFLSRQWETGSLTMLMDHNENAQSREKKKRKKKKKEGRRANEPAKVEAGNVSNGWWKSHSRSGSKLDRTVCSFSEVE
jgi:hypothetical protein